MSTHGNTSTVIKQVIGCASGVSFTKRQEINASDLTTYSTLYINNATGTTQVAAPTGYVDSPCEVGRDAEFSVHCDTSTTPPTPYIKRFVVDFSTATPSTAILNFGLNGAPYTPVTEGVCEGYSLSDGCAEIVNTTNGQITPVRSIQITRYGSLIGTPVFYNITTNAVVTPAGSDRVISCGVKAYTESLLCDSATPQPVSFWRTQIKLGSAVLFTQDLNVGKTAAYTPVGTVGPCASYAIEDEYACIAGANPSDDTVPVRVVRVYNGPTLVSETRTRTDTYAVVANNVPLVPCTEVAEVIQAGSAVSVGTAAFVVPAGRRSVTISVRSGSVTATGSQHSGATSVFEAGESFTWSRVSAGETFPAMTFTGVSATTRFKIIWTV